MTLDENRADLERHARDFAARSGFTYTVLDRSDRGVIGCVYIYPDGLVRLAQGDDDRALHGSQLGTESARDHRL